MSDPWGDVAAWLEGLERGSTEPPEGAPEEVRGRLAAFAAAHASLIRKQDELDKFVYVASHDLGEPLRTVTQFAQLLERRYAGQLDERAARYLHFITDGSDRMRAMLQGLLEFSRAGRAELEPATVDAAALFRREASRVEARVGAVTVGEIPAVTGTPALLEKVVAHLVENGRLYCGDDAPFAVRVSGRAEGDMVRIEVDSDGVGFEPRFADDAFKLFRRLHEREKYPGAGMGLAIVRRIIERHGGESGLEPREDGCLAWFTLPAA